MKIQHTILAASLLAAMSAQAQTNFSVYGTADLAVNNFATTSTAGVKTEENNIVAGGMSTSNIGFRGDREIATGLKATFQFEFEVDQSSDTGIAKTRAGLIGLAGNMGALTIGRRTTLVKVAIDALDAEDINTTGFLGDNARESRLNDRVTYSSPDFSGFSADVQIGFGSNVRETSAVGVVSSTKNGKIDDSMSYGIKYANGPLTVRWVTETIKDSSAKKIKIGEGDAKYEFLPATAGQVADRKNDALGATYDFGLAKLFFVDTKTKQGTAATEVSLNTQTVGVRVPFGAYTFVAKTGTGKAKLTDSTVKADVDAYQLLVMYALAKDTTLYAAYGAESISHSSFTNKKFEQTNAQLGLRYRF
jgi:predicted porin